MLPSPSRLRNDDLFLTFERLFPSVIFPQENILCRKEDDLLLVQSIVRSYLTHLRSIYSHSHIHSTCSSIIDLFLFIEYNFLEKLEKDLSTRMEYLLEIFNGIENLSSNAEAFIRSILYDSNGSLANFVNNYGVALEHLCKATATNINLRFIRRRKQFLRVMRLEQNRKQEIDDLIFHVSYLLHGNQIFLMKVYLVEIR